MEITFETKTKHAMYVLLSGSRIHVLFRSLILQEVVQLELHFSACIACSASAARHMLVDDAHLLPSGAVTVN